jgi:hypothetical protein
VTEGKRDTGVAEGKTKGVTDGVAGVCVGEEIEGKGSAGVAPVGGKGIDVGVGNWKGPAAEGDSEGKGVAEGKGDGVGVEGGEERAARGSSPHGFRGADRLRHCVGRRTNATSGARLSRGRLSQTNNGVVSSIPPAGAARAVAGASADRTRTCRVACRRESILPFGDALRPMSHSTGLNVSISIEGNTIPDEAPPAFRAGRGFRFTFIC